MYAGYGEGWSGVGTLDGVGGKVETLGRGGVTEGDFVYTSGVDTTEEISWGVECCSTADSIRHTC